jgi:mannosyl-3-phosphoglycerate phosphatase family protein
MGRKFIIFTDLDDTLLDKNYSPEKALPIIKKLNKIKIPIIFCSAKTKAEQEVIRKQLNIKHPFIVENGSAIYIPKKYFSKQVGNLENNYETIILGVKAEIIYKEIDKLRKKYKIINYHNMRVKEVSKVTDLDIKAAKRAMHREFGETIIEADEEALRKLKKKFNVVRGGRYIQVFGKNASKGKAAKILIKLYKKEFGDITSLGIGNSYNDKPMLKAVDIPILVKNQDNTWANLKIKNLRKIDGIGPEGWVKAIREFILK